MNYLLVILLMCVGGCSSYKSHFQCQPCMGVACKDSPEIDRMIDQGRIDLRLIDDGQIVVSKDLSRENSRSSSSKAPQIYINSYRDNKGRMVEGHGIELFNNSSVKIKDFNNKNRLKVADKK